MLKTIYNQRITILNKLKRADSLTNEDVWYKHVIDNAARYKKVERGASASSAIINTYTQILIPFQTDTPYMAYSYWKLPGNQDDSFTLSTGDYIILGDVTETILASNIVKIIQQYGDLACQVKHYTECAKRFSATVQLEIEGV
nr:MAG TPA: hypothetical protein [Caudoviricetes sp.]